jgi:hypothetical protein
MCSGKSSTWQLRCVYERVVSGCAGLVMRASDDNGGQGNNWTDTIVMEINWSDNELEIKYGKSTEIFKWEDFSGCA